MEQQMGEGWEPSKKQWSLGNLRAMDGKEPFLRLQNGDNFIFTFNFNSMAAMVNTVSNSQLISFPVHKSVDLPRCYYRLQEIKA